MEKKYVANTECNYLLVCDVSNWGGYALVAGLKYWA